jgi:hypothetical protein
MNVTSCEIARDIIAEAAENAWHRVGAPKRRITVISNNNHSIQVEFYGICIFSVSGNEIRISHYDNNCRYTIWNHTRLNLADPLVHEKIEDFLYGWISSFLRRGEKNDYKSKRRL